MKKLTNSVQIKKKKYHNKFSVNNVKFILNGINKHLGEINNSQKTISKESQKDMLTKPYNISQIIIATITIIITLSILLGAFTTYSYFQDISSIELYSSEDTFLFTNISLFFILIITPIFFATFHFYYNRYKLYQTLKEKQERVTKIKNKIHKAIYINSVVLLFSTLFCMTSYSVGEKKAFSISFIVCIIFLLNVISLQKRINLLINNNKNFIDRLGFFINYLGAADFLLVASFYFPIFTGIVRVDDISSLKYLGLYFFIFIIIIITTPLKAKNMSILEMTKETFLTSTLIILVISITSFFIGSSFNYNMMKMLGKADHSIKPYLIKNHNRYDINSKHIINGITCGKLLWNRGNKYIFLPSYEKNKENNFKINSSEIDLYQGKIRNLICHYFFNLTQSNESIFRISNETIYIYLYNNN